MGPGTSLSTDLLRLSPDVERLAVIWQAGDGWATVGPSSACSHDEFMMGGCLSSAGDNKAHLYLEKKTLKLLESLQSAG